MNGKPIPDSALKGSRVRPLRMHLARGMMLVTALPLLLMSIYYGRVLLVGYHEETGDHLVETAQAAARAANDYLLKHQQAIVSLAAAIEAKGAFDPDTLSQWLGRAQVQYPGFLTLLVANQQGRLVAAHPLKTAKGEDVLAVSGLVSDREYFRQPLATGRPFVSQAFLGRGFGSDPIVAVSTILRGVDQHVIGVIEGSLDLRQFKRFGDDLTRLPGTELIFLDSARKVVYATAGKLYPPLTSEAESPVLRSLQQSGSGQHFVSVRERPDGAGTEKMLSGRSVEVSGAQQFGWTAIVQRPMRVVYAKVYAYLIVVAVVAAVILLLSLAFSGYIARRITQPVEELVGALQQSVSNVVPKLSPQPDSHGIAEMATLLTCFNEMSARLTVAFAEAHESLIARDRLNSDLVASRVALQKAYDEMENHVEERTRELSRVNATLRTLVDHQQAAIVFENTGCKIAFSNTSASRILGLPPQNERLEKTLLGMCDTAKEAFLQPDRFPQLVESMRTLQQLATGVELELVDGRHVELDYAPVMAEGQLVGHLWQFWDITGRKRSEAALQRLSVAVEQSPVSVFITDPRGNIQYVNPKFIAQTGFTAEEALIQPPYMLRSGFQSAEFYQRLWTSARDGKSFHGEICSQGRSGDLRWESIAIAPIRNSGKEISGFVAILDDITTQKAAEHRTQDALRREREANEMKTRFITTISHEFRTPMAGIQMTTDLLVDAGDQLPPEIRLKHLNRILRAVHRFKRILDEVITINRAESGKLFCRTVKVELQPIMEEVVQDCLLAEGRSHRITQSVQGETCPVQVDPDLLRTVLVNLLTNAVKYSNIGTEVLIELRQGSDSYQVVVSDHGIGIPEEDQPRIFLPFERASNVRNIQGTGLGLNIVKRLVELQGGRISFTSRKDHGTTFLVELPTVSNQGTNSNPDSVHSSIVI